MCQFCLNPNQSGDRDADHIDFAGFFSPDAIEQAVRQANALRANDGDDGDGDSDGT